MCYNETELDFERRIMEKTTGGIINPGRQFELDIAKTFAIFFMICVHVSHHMATMDYSTYHGTPLRVIIELFAGPTAAPLFMFAMGVGTVYSSRRQPVNLIRRGIWIFVLGYILNFFRYGIYALAGGIIEGEFMEETLYALTAQDILQFAGLALIVTGILYYFRRFPNI